MTVAGVPAPALLAVSGSRLALVPANITTCYEGNCPGAMRRFEIHTILGGRALVSRALDGAPTAITLSDQLVGVLVSSGSSVSIEYFDPKTAVLKGRKAVPRTVADVLGSSGARIVWQVDKVIHVLNASTGTDVVVATAGSNPIGLTIEGKRITWAEHSGRIRAVYLT